MALEKYILRLEKYFENPDNVKKQKKLCYIAFFLLVFIDFFIHPHHAAILPLGLDHIPGFNALFGFLACAITLIGSKWIGGRWLSKPKDFYDK